MIEVRVGPDGWIAQLMPAGVIAPEQWAGGRRWLCMSWPSQSLQAAMLTDDEVADWRVVYHDESTRTDPQRTDNAASLSHDLAPDEEDPR